MKLKAQIVPQENVPDNNIADLETQLKELGLDEQKIQEIVDSMKAVTPSTTSPQVPPNPLAPQEPATGVQPTPNILQPGMTMKRLQQKEDPIEDLFEEKFEEYLDSGEDFDMAVHKSHKHLERIVDYLELYEVKAQYSLDDLPPEYYPRLSKYIEDGTIRWDSDHNEYVGIAEDGVELSFGNDPGHAERYLKANPNPSDW